MKVTVSTHTNECFLLDVSEDLELENFKAFCEVQSGYPAHETAIEFQGVLLQDNKKTLKNHGIQDGDLVLLKHLGTYHATPAAIIPNLDFSGIVIPSAVNSSNQPSSNSLGDDPATVRQLLLDNPQEIALLQQNNPRLANALLNGTPEDFERILRQQYEEREKREQLRLRMLNAHPFDTEAQQLIAEEIKKNNIEANMEAAMEYNPETFGTVVMLYINCKVNGYPVKAFIDSGAQTTIMSLACAERVNIMRLLDTRWAGIAKGVGVQKILGRIHMVDIAIESDHLTTSFSVLEEQRIDMLLGLDMLKRHQCCIDLRKNVLRIGTTGTETPFLSEGDLPEVLRLTHSDDDDELLKKALQESKNMANGAGTSMMSNGLEPSTSSSSATNPQSTTNVQFSEEDVIEITKNGFSRDQAISELTNFNGDKNKALAALLAKSLIF
ncbi:hypothetical protein WDU94_009096 [Cyamophila willieti]